MIKNITPNDRSKIIQILSESFKENKSVKYVLRSPSRIKKLMKYSVAKVLLIGDVWINDQKNCCALIMNPKKKISPIKDFLLTLDLVVNVLPISRIKKILKKESDLKKYHPKDKDYVHLWFLAVDTNVQGKGLGKKMLQEIINHYKNKCSYIYLETSTEENIDFYKNFGFEIYKTLNYSFDYHLFKKKL